MQIAADEEASHARARTQNPDEPCFIDRVQVSMNRSNEEHRTKITITFIPRAYSTCNTQTFPRNLIFHTDQLKFERTFCESAYRYARSFGATLISLIIQRRLRAAMIRTDCVS